MAKQQDFVWLLDNQMPRFGPELKKGATHDGKKYRQSDVAWWVEQGAAKYTKSKKDGGE